MIAKKPKKGARKPRLTPEQMASRENAIIEDIKAGVLSYREIALKNGVSLPTVNNKARKAGISRGRRKGAKIVVAPLRRRAKKVAKKAGKKTGRKVARKATKKVARRGPGRPRTLPIISDQAVAPVVRRRRRKVARRKVAGSGAAATGRAKGNFLEALREVVLKYHPEVSLLKFEKMLKAVEAAV